MSTVLFHLDRFGTELDGECDVCTCVDLPKGCGYEHYQVKLTKRDTYDDTLIHTHNSRLRPLFN